jgi:hypothetical protein
MPNWDFLNDINVGNGYNQAQDEIQTNAEYAIAKDIPITEAANLEEFESFDPTERYLQDGKIVDNREGVEKKDDNNEWSIVDLFS